MKGPEASESAKGQARLRRLAMNALALVATASLGVQAAAAPGARASAAFAPSCAPAGRDLSSLGLQPLRGARAACPLGRRLAAAAAAPKCRRSALLMSLRDRGESSFNERNHMQKMIKDFVTQRAVQTHLFTIQHVGDRNEFDWIEGYMGHQGLSGVHGYGALRGHWKDYMSGMMRLPEQSVTKKAEYYRGGTKGNPFIQPQVIEHTSTVSPRKITNNIMEMRALISKEWVQDLQNIARENEEHWRHHLAMVTNGTDPEQGLQHRLIEPTEADTALRLDNYDLLERFCTHVASTQVTMELAADKSEEHSAMWFKGYMQDKSYFAHTGTRGAGRQFLKDMLNEPPRVLTLTCQSDGDTKMKLIDPMDIAARIMAQRQIVAESWIQALEETEEDQLNIQREFMTECFDVSSIVATLERLIKKGM